MKGTIMVKFLKSDQFLIYKVLKVFITRNSDKHQQIKRV